MNTHAPEAVVDVQALHKSFGQNHVLRGIDFRVGAGEVVCVIGPSGSGKSTLLRCLNVLEQPDSGTVRIRGVDLTDPDCDIDAARRHIGMVFQHFNLFPHYRAIDNCAVAQRSVLGRSKEEARKVARMNLERVGLGDKLDAHPAQLSGGQQQRVAIARALVADADVLLMDEPFSGLDEITARRLRKELLSIWSATHKTILFVTHNCFEATFLADRILLMSSRPGRVYEEVPIDLPRPRDYDDPHLFTVNAGIVRNFLKTIGEE